MIVDVVAPGFGFVQIEMMAVGDQAFMKLSKDAPWASLPLDQVPFNFAGLGTTLQNLLTRIEDGTITGPEAMLDIQAYRVETSITSEELSDLITSVDSGHTVSLTLWIDEAGHTLRQIKIDGQLYDDDAPETVRLVIIEAVDIPVEIELPDIGS
ncbi:MAG: LppX_LprAFG lipoprotein [Chloroflexi bacterium]|nr:LppX_LprAFG lipoprotein [Chloroflexota bacterium]